jgi:Fe-S-cluster-containing dehydrogenase component
MLRCAAAFCVQRLQEGKLKAKKENRPLKDLADVQTACQQACSSDAIIFGNVNDKESLVSRTRKDNSQRLFYVIEETHTLPNVNYLAKVRHTDVIRGVKEEVEETAGAEKAEKHA